MQKRLKDEPLFVERNADPSVTHDDMEMDIFRAQTLGLDLHHHFSVSGEFNGIIDQIDQDLTQTTDVTEQRIGDVRTDIAHEGELLLVGSQRQRLEDIPRC